MRSSGVLGVGGFRVISGVGGDPVSLPEVDGFLVVFRCLGILGVGGLLAIAGVGGDPVSLLCDARVSGGLR